MALFCKIECEALEAMGMEKNIPPSVAKINIPVSAMFQLLRQWVTVALGMIGGYGLSAYLAFPVMRVLSVMVRPLTHPKILLWEVREAIDWIDALL